MMKRRKTAKKLRNIRQRKTNLNQRHREVVFAGAMFCAKMTISWDKSFSFLFLMSIVFVFLHSKFSRSTKFLCFIYCREVAGVNCVGNFYWTSWCCDIKFGGLPNLISFPFFLHCIHLLKGLSQLNLEKISENVYLYTLWLIVNTEWSKKESEAKISILKSVDEVVAVFWYGLAMFYNVFFVCENSA